MEVEGCGCNAFLNDSMGISPFMSFIIAWVHSNEQGFSILSTHTTLWEINVYVHVSLWKHLKQTKETTKRGNKKPCLIAIRSSKMCG
jgi:hypothetical protein